MQKQFLLRAIAAVLAWIVLAISAPVHAGTPQQQFATNTPLPDGRIIYRVLAGDTCAKIQLLHSITFDQLRQLNQTINVECTNLIEGQEVLIGTAGSGAQVPATPGASPTPGLPTVTPTPFTGTTEICVLLFDDRNGDALRQEDEPVIPGGAISVAETTGEYSATQETNINPDPEAYAGVCFLDVPEGQYNIGAAIPDNYNPTMSLTYTLDVRAGDRAFVDFGAQNRDSRAAQPSGAQPGGDGGSPILGVVGAVLLLGGIGLGWYALRLRTPRGRLPSGGLLRR